MSQNDLTIANQGFASFRSDLNSALQALGSTNSGTSAPSTTFANQLFYDTANNILKIRNEDNDAFISLFTLDQTNDNIESLTVNGVITADSLDISGNIDVDGTTNLDVVDIDGALTQDGGAVFNEASADVDFRVESNGETHMLFVQAGADCLGIKTASPNNYYADDLVLTVPDEGGMTIVNSTTHRGYLAFADGTSGSQAYRGFISYDHNDDTLYLGTDGGGKLLIDTNGAMTNNQQPAFYAETSSTQTDFGLSSTHTLAFGTERFDQHSDFASNTFTAPVDGRYFLNTTLRLEAVDTSAVYYLWGFDTSNHDYVSILYPSFVNDLAYISVNQTVLADMDAGDTAKVIFQQVGGTQQTDLQGASGYSYFCGHLVT